jgi:hypothetical protein
MSAVEAALAEAVGPVLVPISPTSYQVLGLQQKTFLKQYI